MPWIIRSEPWLHANRFMPQRTEWALGCTRCKPGGAVHALREKVSSSLSKKWKWLGLLRNFMKPKFRLRWDVTSRWHQQACTSRDREATDTVHDTRRGENISLVSQKRHVKLEKRPTSGTFIGCNTESHRCIPMYAFSISYILWVIIITIRTKIEIPLKTWTRRRNATFQN